MNLRNIVYLLLVVLMAASCQKILQSKIPQIELMSFGPTVVKVNYGVPILTFSMKDGDADLGNRLGSGKYDIFVKDFRYDTGYVGYYFPADFDPSIEDPDKGIKGTCEFQFVPTIFTPRIDSLHMATGDTTHFEVYIVDRGGNQSNHIVTDNVILTP